MAFRILSVLLLLAIIACGGGPQTGPPPEQRILSLSPHATQMLEAFGALDHVVGITDYCPLPDTHPGIPRVGGLMNPNVELILSLRPTLAFHAPTARDLEERLRRAGIRVVALPNETLRNIHGSLRTMGSELGMEERAEELISESRSALDALTRELAGRPRPVVLCVIGHTPGTLRDIHAAGPNTFLDELIRHAGGTNRMAESPTRYPQVSRESLIRNPPQVVLMASPVGGWSEQDRRFLVDAWRDLLGPAASSVRVEFLEDPRITIPGPFVHESARKIALLIHPAADGD